MSRPGRAHCDHAKGKRALEVIHPYRAPVRRFVKLGSRGKLTVAGEAKRDLDEVLNLNAKHLQRLRQRALKAVMADFDAGKRPGSSWKARDLRQALDELHSRKEALHYQPLIEDWLERQLRRRPK